MRKFIFIIFIGLFLSGCLQIVALLGPAAVTGTTSGKIVQSAFSYSLSYGVKRTTGKTILENVMDIGKEKRAKNKKNEKLINILSYQYPR